MCMANYMGYLFFFSLCSTIQHPGFLLHTFQSWLNHQMFLVSISGSCPTTEHFLIPKASIFILSTSSSSVIDPSTRRLLGIISVHHLRVFHSAKGWECIHPALGLAASVLDDSVDGLHHVDSFGSECNHATCRSPSLCVWTS